MTDSSNQQQAGPFARLPNELLLAILEYIDDRPLASLTDKERVERPRTLSATCLVSKRFYEVARRVLWCQMELQPSGTRRSDQQALDLTVEAMQAAPESARAVKTLVICWWWEHKSLSFGKVVDVLPNVEEVEIRTPSFVDLGEISKFSKLRRLDAVEEIYPRVSTPVAFPHLTTLNFHGVRLDFVRSDEPIFTTTTLPALRHLSLRACIEVKNQRGSQQLHLHFPILPRAFVDQLDDSQLDVRDRRALMTHHFPTYGAAEIPPVLRRCGKSRLEDVATNPTVVA